MRRDPLPASVSNFCIFSSQVSKTPTDLIEFFSNLRVLTKIRENKFYLFTVKICKTSQTRKLCKKAAAFCNTDFLSHIEIH